MDKRLYELNSSTVRRHTEDHSEQQVMHEWISVSGKWLILTYCCRNVSVGRVIGIHIGRVMGGREHSVVVDSERWTKTMEKNSDSHLRGHMTEDTREQWGEDNRRNVVCRYETEWCWQHSKSFSSFVSFTWGVTPHHTLKSIPDPSSILTFL